YINKVIGVIELLNKKSGIFTKEDEELLHALADHAAISIAHSRLLENQQSDMINITEIFVAAQDSYNHEKKGHARRVANYANLIGRKMGIPENELRNLHYACLFHDIGLIKISIDEQLLKERYKQHPQFGYDMIQPISLWSTAAELILNHHERYDGNGYPSGKKGKEIPLGTRILFVAEVFDVLTSKNSYKDPIDRDAAINEIDVNAGLQFDPEVVKAFKEAIKDSELIVE
ncbi:MAG: HD domain-containing phosphohydrolase, partial [Nitrospirota bacterium]